MGTIGPSREPLARRNFYHRFQLIGVGADSRSATTGNRCYTPPIWRWNGRQPQSHS